MHQFHHLDGCQAMGINSLSIFFFLGLVFFITFIPLNNLIIITIIIVITSQPYLFLCNKPISDTYQGEDVIPYCLITHLLTLRVIRDIAQLPWVYLNCFFTHLLSFKTVRNKEKSCRVNAHYIVAHFLRPKMMMDKSHRVWVVGHCLVGHLLPIILIRNILQ